MNVIITDNMVKIQIAIESGATARNEKGERIAIPKNYDRSCGHPPTGDCIKCYIKDMFYWSSAAMQKEIFVNEQLFDEWFELQPLKW